MSNLTISDHDTPDPWMLSHGPNFYLTFTAGDRIEIWRSPNMENFRSCDVAVAWRPGPPEHPWFVDLWAPELHYVNGTWYVYFTGAKPNSDPGTYNAGRRTLLLRCRGQDPMEAGAWEFVGQVKGLPDHWNIDATVFQAPRTGKLYCCYSGWPMDDFSDTQQDLFLVEMENPEVAREGSVVCISKAELTWERTGDNAHGVNEGPTFVDIPGFQGIVYSANGSWTSDYRLGVLALIGDDPLNASSWAKRATPLLVSDKAHGGPFGPGHASFIPSPHGNGRVYCIYHATEFPDQGWANRKARVLRFGAEHFLPGAETMCCALSLTGQWSGGAATSSSIEPGQGGQEAQDPQMAQGHGRKKSLIDRISQKLKNFT